MKTSRFNFDLPDFVGEERLMEGLLNLDLFGIGFFDLRGNFIRVNKAWSNILGYSEMEFMSKTIFEITHSEDVKKIKEMMEKLRKGDIQQINFKKRFVNKRRDTVWVNFNCSVQKDNRGFPLFYYAVIKDISSEKKIKKIIKYRLDAERIVKEISTMLLLDKNPDLNKILQSIGEFARVDRAYAFKISENGKMKNTHEWCAPGVKPQIEKLKNLPLERFPWWMEKLQKQQTIEINDVDNLPEEAGNEKAILKEQSIKSLLALPVFSRKNILLGFIGFDGITRKRRWDQGGINLLKIVAEMIGVYWGYQKEKSYMESTLNSLVHTLNLIMGIRDPYTTKHQERVAKIAVAIGKEMGLSEQRLKKLRIASMLHDIGKIKIPAEILTKPGELSKREFELIKEHSQVGHDILVQAGFDKTITQIVSQHHERIDGSGYPEGLKGEQILLEAKILGVADVIEAMSSHRPYRSALGIKVALAELGNYAGIKYDRKVVKACYKIFASIDGEFKSVI